MSLQGRRILLGVSGGIAAYKTPDLVRRLREQGASVRVVLTQGGANFVTPMSLQAVSGYPVLSTLWDEANEAAMSHIELARWADTILVAPATANLIAKLALGIADDLLTTLVLASSAKLALAPAMNMQMYLAATTQAHLATLQARGAQLIGPASGEQACGDIGPGRMVEPLEIVAALTPAPQLLQGCQLVITAGPTREAIDPVRYISNHSSGKMGFALASAAANLGARVTLISGPVNLNTPANVSRIDVTSAEQMLQAAQQASQDADIFIGCAAVADYRVAHIASQKMKKTSADELSLQLVKNPDILASIASQPNAPFCVGFAAETQDVRQYALDKLKRKHLALIAANDVSQPGLGFNSDDNALLVLGADFERQLPAMPKGELAVQLMTIIAEKFNESR